MYVSGWCLDVRFLFCLSFVILCWVLLHSKVFVTIFKWLFICLIVENLYTCAQSGNIHVNPDNLFLVSVYTSRFHWFTSRQWLVMGCTAGWLSAWSSCYWSSQKPVSLFNAELSSGWLEVGVLPNATLSPPEWSCVMIGSGVRQFHVLSVVRSKITKQFS